MDDQLSVALFLNSFLPEKFKREIKKIGREGVVCKRINRQSRLRSFPNLSSKENFTEKGENQQGILCLWINRSIDQ